ncbi:hypothetical protein ACG33_07925 [Steroidobacter denitrificans]|uniref:Uncharacterized protein n=1 Tax=Steroidobacter denitrificans TaxID=465721 RepID=A0A127F9C7_STEDE|nr:TraR/DksA family transcriptional regulator [Steroidobacter denitrificans]AMN47024.1 hypothetical protein ACG33_07925 [Steroidobacter denitrificans]
MTQASSLEEVRAALLQRRKELATRTQRVGFDLARGNEPLVQDFSDQAIQTQNDATLEAIGTAAVTEITAIDHALLRLAQGDYGICENCDAPIDAERLRIVPYATTCGNCRTLRE